MKMELRRAFIHTYLLSVLFPSVLGQTTSVRLSIVIPTDDKRTKDQMIPALSNCRRNISSSSRVLRRSNIRISSREKFLTGRRSAVNNVLDMFCNDIFGNANALMTINSNSRDTTAVRTIEYTNQIAEEYGYPVISWDPSYSGSLEYEKEKLVLQMAPTIYHQAIAILQLLKTFNWTHFTIVTTTNDDYFEFLTAIDLVMKEHESKRKLTDKFSYTRLQTLVLPVSKDRKKSVLQMVRYFQQNHLDENRIYLLHAVSDKRELFQAAQKYGLMSPERVWILTSQTVGIFSRNFRTSLPVGIIGVTHQFPKEIDLSLQVVLGNAGKVWATAMENLAKSINSNDVLPQFSCDNSSARAPWKYGKLLYQYMKQVSIMEEYQTIAFHENGLSKYVDLQIVNVQQDYKSGNIVWKQVLKLHEGDPNNYLTALTKTHPKTGPYQVMCSGGVSFPVRLAATAVNGHIGKWIPVQESGAVELKLFLDGIMWPDRSGTPPKGRPAKRFFRISTLQEEPYVMYRRPNNKTGQCTEPAGKCRIMYNSTLHGNDSHVENGTIEWCCAGLSIDLLKIMSEKMEFDYELYEVPDKVCGVKNQRTGEWNGLIKQLQSHKADMVITSLQITPNRASAVDFSIPYLETGTAIIVSLRRDKVSPTAVLEPYNYSAWCLILIFSVHSIGASIFIFEWLSPRGLDQGRTPMREHSFSLFRSFWLIWAMLFQSSVSADNPRGVSSRFLGNVWALFALVFLASYTANLAAFMITKDTYYRLTGLQDSLLVNPYQHKPPFKFGTIPNGSTEETLRQYHNQMFNYMTKYRYNQQNVSAAILALKKGVDANEFTSYTFGDCSGVGSVGSVQGSHAGDPFPFFRIGFSRDDNQAFIYDASPLQYQVGIDKDCKLMMVGKPNAMSGYGVAFPKGSDKLVEETNKIILDLQENGELGRLRNFWLSGACHKKSRIKQSSDKLGILNFTSAFILLATGIVVGGVLLIFEHTYFRFGRKCLKKYDKWGCCALVSLSMGKSLTFEQSVMDAVDFCKKHKCKDPLCETQIWKVKHELDLALLKIEKLNSELRRSKTKAIKSAADSEPYSPLNKSDSNTRKSVDLKGEDDDSHYASLEKPEPEDVYSNKQETVAEVNNQNHTGQSDNNGVIRRQPSYDEAVGSDAADNDDQNFDTGKSKTRYNDGKYYMNVDTAEDDGLV